MAAECLASINLCAVRVTRLDSIGNPSAGPNNVYITDKPMAIQVKPVIEQGQDKTLIGGCDCIIATYRGNDKLKRFEFELDLGVMEPALIEMLTGGTAILDNLGNPIGIWFPSQANCTAAGQPLVAIEAWQLGWTDDRQDATWPYIRWVWPATKWQWSDYSLMQDFAQPKLTGFSRGNSQWGNGPFNDTPRNGAEQVGINGGFFYDTTIPVARCGYQTYGLS